MSSYSLMHGFGSFRSVAMLSGVAIAIGSAVMMVRRNYHTHSPSTSTVKSFTELHDKNDSKVHLYTFPSNLMAPSLTPFGVRVETFLRLGSIPYEKHYTTNTSASPTRSLPLVVYKGECITDSHQIIDVLSEKFNVHLDEHLTESARATGKAICAMVDYNIIFSLGRAFYIDDTTGIVIPYIAAGLGIATRWTRWLKMVLRRNYYNKLNDIGILRIPKEQYEHALLSSMKALEDILGDRPFFGGETPSVADCAVFACLLLPVRLYFLTQNRPHRQLQPMYSKDHKHINQRNVSSSDKTHKERTAETERAHGLSSSDLYSDVFINEGLTYLVNSYNLVGYVLRMSDLVFPDLDHMLAPASPTRVQKDVDVLAAQMDNIKTRIERLSKPIQKHV